MPSLPPSSRPAPEIAYEDEAVDFRRLAAAIWRQRLLVGLLSVGGLVAGFALSRLLQPVYEAQAALQVPVATRGFSSSAALRSAPLFEGRGWIELLRSFAVMDEVVRRRRLYLQPQDPSTWQYFADFTLAPAARAGDFVLASNGAGRLELRSAAGETIESVAVGDSVGRELGFRWVPPAPNSDEVAFRVLAPRDAAVRLNEQLETILPLDGALLRISLRGTDPGATAGTLNALADRFVEVATQLKREKLTTVTEALREQLEVARGELAAAERALEEYQVNTITLPSDRGATPIAPGLAETRDPVRQAFFRLRLEREDLVRDRNAVQRALETRGDSAASLSATLAAIPAARDYADLSATLARLTLKRGEARQMRIAFSSTYPPLRQLEQEIAEIENVEVPRLIADLRRSLDERIADYDVRIAASSREMQLIPVRTIEESRRQRNVEVATNLYTEVQAAYESARLAELSSAPDVRLLDYAVQPSRPVTDQVIFVIVGGFVLGLGGGLALAILLDRFDRRLRYPTQVTRDLGLPILGALPLLRTNRDGTPVETDHHMLLEAGRTIRMGLLFAHGTAGPFVVTITSPGGGDGKSFVSLVLARSFALAGRRTLLIDGDNRRGYLHRTLGVPRRPGLSEVLEGQLDHASAIVRPRDEAFDFLPTGTPKADAPELLASSGMNRMMMELRSQYEAIIIDSPPLGAGVDPIILASLSGTLALVLRNGLTDRELAGARLDDLRRLSIRVLGAVLNDVKPTGAYRYYTYLPGYSAGKDDPRDAKAVAVKALSGSDATIS